MTKYLLMLLLILPVIGQADEINNYFPKGKLDSDDWVDSQKIQIFSKILVAMKEPSLWQTSKKTLKSEVYRFILIRSFRDPACVRIEISDSGSVTIFGKVYRRDQEYKNGYKGEFLINKQKSLPKYDIQSFLKQIDDANFWDLNPEDYPIYIKMGDKFTFTTDGSSWIFEGFKNGKYQLIDIPMGNYGSDDLNKIIIELGKSFLSIADLKVDPLY